MAVEIGSVPAGSRCLGTNRYEAVFEAPSGEIVRLNLQDAVNKQYRNALDRVYKVSLAVKSGLPPEELSSDCVQVVLDGWEPMNTAPRGRSVLVTMGGKTYLGGRNQCEIAEWPWQIVDPATLESDYVQERSLGGWAPLPSIFNAPSSPSAQPQPADAAASE